MDENVVIASHPRYGYCYDLKINNSHHLVSTVPELGATRTSVFDEIKTPAYKKQHNVFHDYSIGRSSPVWNVKRAALNISPSGRLTDLSQPKKTHPHYVPGKSVQTVISKAAKRASASDRLETLASPKNLPNIVEREWSVKKGALRAKASERVTELANPKHVPAGFMPDKIDWEIWQVSRAAVKTKPSKRLDELAQPAVRQVGSNLPKENAFEVSKAAQRARCSDRLMELARPIIRGGS